MSRRSFRTAFLLLGLIILQHVSAFEFSPLSVELSPHGSGSRTAFRLSNRSDSPEAVQISIVTREMDVDGREVYADATDDFTVYPTQLILMPNTAKTVRLQWNGESNPESELSYRIIAENLPISFPGDGPAPAVSVNILLRYMGSVYVTPESSAPEVAVALAATREGADGSRDLEIVLRNQGTAHQIIKDFELHLSSQNANGKVVILDASQLEGMDGSNILAGQQRRFFLPWPEDLSDGPIRASIEYQ